MGRGAGPILEVGGRLTPRLAVVLVGLSGSGKSTVAPIAATLLGAPWCDLDRRIAERAGVEVVDIFSRYGEARFRELERAEMSAALEEPPQVVAAGGGWAAEPGNLASVKGRAVVIHLSITPEQAARRLRSALPRPLLAGRSLVDDLAAQLARRQSWYRLADLEITVDDRDPAAVAAVIAASARHRAGW